MFHDLLPFLDLLFGQMAAESARRSKLTQTMTDHVLCDIDRHVPPGMNGDRGTI
jgi:hypothetical protein